MQNTTQNKHQIIVVFRIFVLFLLEEFFQIFAEVFKIFQGFFYYCLSMTAFLIFHKGNYGVKEKKKEFADFKSVTRRLYFI
jgi:hypothetical protein